MENDLELMLKDNAKVNADLEWQRKPVTELKRLDDALKTICKAYGRPFLGKNKQSLIETIQLGPNTEMSMSECVNRLLKEPFSSH